MNPAAWIQKRMVLAAALLFAAGLPTKADTFNFTINGPNFSGMGRISGYLEAPYPTGDPGLYRVTGMNATFTYLTESLSVNRGYGDFTYLPKQNEYFFSDVVGVNSVTGANIGIYSEYRAPNTGAFYISDPAEDFEGGGGFDNLLITPVALSVPAPVAGSGLVPVVVLSGFMIARRIRRRRCEV